MDGILVGAILLIVGGPAGWQLGVFWKEPAVIFFAAGTLILLNHLLT